MNRLAEKFIDIYRRSTFIRYCVVGGISWVTDAVTLIAVNRLTPQLLTDDVTRLAVATYAGGIVGFVVNYILTLIMAFNSGVDKRTGKKFSAFLIILAVSIVGWVMKEWLMNLGVNILLLGDEWLVNIPVSAIVLAWNYLGRKLFVFRTGKHDIEKE